MVGRKRKHKIKYLSRKWIVFFLLAALFLVNSYVYIRLIRISESWSLSVLPGSLATQTAQLAFILLLNNLAIAYHFYLLWRSKR